MEKETVSFDGCYVEREADEALLVRIPDVSDEPQWVPKSKKVLAHDESEIFHKGDAGTLVIYEWYVKEKEWV